MATLSSPLTRLGPIPRQAAAIQRLPARIHLRAVAIRPRLALTLLRPAAVMVAEAEATTEEGAVDSTAARAVEEAGMPAAAEVVALMEVGAAIRIGSPYC